MIAFGSQLAFLIFGDLQMSKIYAKLNLSRTCNLIKLSLSILPADKVTKVLKKKTAKCDKPVWFQFTDVGTTPQYSLPVTLNFP
jgi:hypothetical protein